MLTKTAIAVSLPMQKGPCTPQRENPRAYSSGEERGCNAGPHGTSHTYCHFSKIKKCNQAMKYIEIKTELGKMR